jgi:hypothetical protein
MQSYGPLQRAIPTPLAPRLSRSQLPALSLPNRSGDLHRTADAGQHVAI